MVQDLTTKYKQSSDDDKIILSGQFAEIEKIFKKTK